MEAINYSGSRSRWFEVTLDPDKKRKVACTLICMVYCLQQIPYFALQPAIIYTHAFLIKQGNNGLTMWLIFQGATYSLCFLTGYISDTFIQRYWTLVIGFILRVICAGLVFLLGYPELFSQQGLVIYCYGVLFLIAVGSSIIKVNLPSFGADQLRRHREDGLSTQQVVNYFHAIFMSLSLATLFSFTVITWLYANTQPYIPAAVTVSCLILGFILYLAGTPYYTRFPANARLLSSTWNIVVESFKVRKVRREAGLTELPLLENAKMENNGKYTTAEVNITQDLFRVLFLLLVLIPYWSASTRIDNLDQLPHPANCHSNTTNQSGIEVMAISNTASSSSANHQMEWSRLFAINTSVISIIALIPIALICYFSLTKAGYSIKLWILMTIGMVVCSIAVIFDGLAIKYAQYDEDCDMDKPIYLAYIRDATNGFSEVLTVIPGYMLTYMLSPRAYQGTVMGLLQSFTGVGSLAMVLATSIDGYSPWALAAVLGVSTIIFVGVAHVCNLMSKNMIVQSFYNPL